MKKWEWSLFRILIGFAIHLTGRINGFLRISCSHERISLPRGMGSGTLPRPWLARLDAPYKTCAEKKQDALFPMPVSRPKKGPQDPITLALTRDEISYQHYQGPGSRRL